jgi:hypothetical protein
MEDKEDHMSKPLPRTKSLIGPGRPHEGSARKSGTTTAGKNFKTLSEKYRIPLVRDVWARLVRLEKKEGWNVRLIWIAWSADWCIYVSILGPKYL